VKEPDVARRRLGNTGLSASGFDAADEVVRWHGAMQSQDYGPTKWSIGQRTAGLIDGDFDEALASGSIIRTHVLRPTWHFVTPEDARWLLALTGPRVEKQTRPRYEQLGLDAGTLARCEKLILSALEGGNHLTRADIGSALDAAGIDRSGQRLPHILMYCEFEAAICSGPLVGKQHAYAAFDERVPSGRTPDRDAAMRELVRRYLGSHGPATVQDLRWWSSLMVADIKKALDELGPEVHSQTTGDLVFWSMASDETDPAKPRGARLLHIYDEFIVGYTQSRFFGDPRAPSAGTWRDRRLPTGVVLLNGTAAGHWRRTIVKDSINVDFLLYVEPKPTQMRALEAGAADLGRFLGRRATVSVQQL
jgi:hypothetical protein